jgi:hypothetical protein
MRQMPEEASKVSTQLTQREEVSLLSGSTLHQYEGGCRFESHLRHTLFRQNYLVVLLSPFREMPGYCLHYAIIVSFQIISNSLIVQKIDEIILGGL